MFRPALLIILPVLALAGCGRHYHLPGHHDGNLNNPPDVILHPGDRVQAVSTGWVVLVLKEPVMSSSDPSVVETQNPTIETAVLIAKRPGTAVVRYEADATRKEPNFGFRVHVLPLKP